MDLNRVDYEYPRVTFFAIKRLESSQLTRREADMLPQNMIYCDFPPATRNLHELMCQPPKWKIHFLILNTRAKEVSSAEIWPFE